MTAASRRSLGSVSVPVRRVVLSHPLPVIALVSFYLTNKLIGHRPLPFRHGHYTIQECSIRQWKLSSTCLFSLLLSTLAHCNVHSFIHSSYDKRNYAVLAPLSRSCSPAGGRLPMCYAPVCHSPINRGVRLACLSHAASVHPEPGSNSHKWKQIQRMLPSKKLKLAIKEIWTQKFKFHMWLLSRFQLSKFSWRKKTSLVEGETTPKFSTVVRISAYTLQYIQESCKINVVMVPI